MASILDEYEDSLSRSAVLQTGCPSVGIPHSGKLEESVSASLCYASFYGGGKLKSLRRVFRISAPGLSCLAQLVSGLSLKEPQEQPRDLGPTTKVLQKRELGLR